MLNGRVTHGGRCTISRGYSGLCKVHRASSLLACCGWVDRCCLAIPSTIAALEFLVPRSHIVLELTRDGLQIREGLLMVVQLPQVTVQDRVRL